ncbi:MULTISPECIES: MATE family efflux transporter [Butyricimonas]|uniref:MATE family efflux transporter n=1 Tax=Butyricimonas TaxID=574697 RepID=UPI001D0892D0|nr:MULTISPECIES: MATE family efflux transporter [Butyricimonas]MCB6974307.1 MATE family efflux transporter [Butyricimonas synergistica]MCG4521133.1 MATE family efflux transporter [Butyricimonas sp. DFI.6.44]
MNYTYKQIWLINYPVMMSILMEQLINITDALFLGHVGEVELGASALACVYYMAIYILGFGFSLGLQVMIARKNGEQQYEKTGRTFFQGLFFLCGLAVALILVSYWITPPVMQYFISSPQIYQAVIDYLNWRCFGLLFSFPFLAFRSFYVGITKTKVLTLVALTAVIINIPCNYLFIFGLNLGIAGAAMASSFAEAGSLLIILIYTLRVTDKVKYGLQMVYDGKLLKAVLRLSGWSMMHSFVSTAPWFLFFIAIERLGEVQLAVSNITRSVSTLFFVIVNSFGATTASLVSNLIGEGKGNQLFPLCRKILKLGYAIGLPLIVLALLFSRQIMGCYTDNTRLIEIASTPFIVMLLNYLFAVPGFVYISALTGTGDTRTAFIFQVTTIIVYLIYLYVLSYCFTTPLAVYLTAEYVFVAMLGIQSYIYLKRKQIY